MAKFWLFAGGKSGEVNEEVEVRGLTKSTDLNGKVGKIAKLPEPGEERVTVPAHVTKK